MGDKYGRVIERRDSFGKYTQWSIREYHNLGLEMNYKRDEKEKIWPIIIQETA